MRCQSCGRQGAADTAECVVCGDPLVTITPSGHEASTALPTEWRGVVPAVRDASNSVSSHADRRLAQSSQPVATATSSRTVTQNQGDDQVRGRVILVEGPVPEPAAFDPILLVCQMLWLGLLLLLPLLVAHAIMHSFLVGPGLLLILVIAWGLGLISPLHVLQTLTLIFRMGEWGRMGGDTIPARYLRIRDMESDRESVVRMVGHLSSANVLVDDLVAFSGKWRRGVLHAKRGQNLRTGSRIRLRRTRSRLLLAVTVIVYVLVIAAFVAIAHRPQLAGVG